MAVGLGSTPFCVEPVVQHPDSCSPRAIRDNGNIDAIVCWLLRQHCSPTMNAGGVVLLPLLFAGYQAI